MKAYEIRKHIEDWKKTGRLIDDEYTVRQIYSTYLNISNVAVNVPGYELMRKDAIENSYKLEDIMKARGYK